VNWGILGHEWAVTLLRQHIVQGTFHHAYLLVGPQGIGRRTLALRFAQALSCPQPLAPGEPCRTCRTCTHIEHMEHPDLAVVQAERIGGTLRVDQVRQLQHNLALSPYEARFRVALLLRFEEAHLSAANALLKTLEEPPPHVILLLTAESTESLLPTIVSRCEVLRLRPLPYETVSQGLQRLWGVPEEQARLLAHVAGGRPGYALQLYHNPEQWSLRERWLKEHYHLLTSSRVERFNYAEGLSKDRERLHQVLLVWMSLWRDVVLQAAKASIPLSNPHLSQESAALAAQWGLPTAYRTLMALQRTLDRLERNVNPRLAIEVLMLDLPHFS